MHSECAGNFNFAASICVLCARSVLCVCVFWFLCRAVVGFGVCLFWVLFDGWRFLGGFDRSLLVSIG